jgi:hypothetical protein
VGDPAARAQRQLRKRLRVGDARSRDGTAGIVTVTPAADTATVRARSKTSFGFCVLRNTVSASKLNSQVLVKTLIW